MKSRQTGFTLVEIAIVLVIIGLLLGGVLKGQEMVTNAKIKNVANDLKGVAAAFYAYQDRYRVIPGDDAGAATRFVGAQPGGGNGAIAGVFTAAPAALGVATESNNFWQHLRMAGLMTGSGFLPPQNAVGGVTGVQQPASTYGMTGVVVCTSNVPWKIAQAVDAQLDDGDSATGSVRAGAPGIVATAAATAASYGPTVPAAAALEAGLYTVCMQI